MFNIKKKYVNNIVLLFSILFLSGCQYYDFGIKYKDNELSTKLEENFKSELNNLELENYCHIGFNKENDIILLNYNKILEIKDYQYATKKCDVSYFYIYNLFFYNGFLFKKSDILKYGRKEYFKIIKDCIESDLELLKDKQIKRKIENERLNERLNEKLNESI